MKISMSLRSPPQSPTPIETTTSIMPFFNSTPSSTLYKPTLFDIFTRPQPINNQNELDEYLFIHKYQLPPIFYPDGRLIKKGFQ